ncbi:oleate hydratase [Rhodococcus pyridinivorans]|uniref:oleate hydratase n=1 Tax=Rhodococcus pyridinivorans TaxID=103816 RepID=UPI003556F841
MVVHLLSELHRCSYSPRESYESLVLPMYRWLLDQGVRFEFSTEVTDIDFVFDGDRKRLSAFERGVC